MGDPTAEPAPARLHLAAVVIAVAVFAADLALKLYVLYGLDLASGPVTLAPFLDLVLVWNRGISYGLFAQDHDLGRWLLVAVTGVATIGLGIWMLRTTRRLTAISLALVVGGALGNGVDRVVYGAVVDFVYLHVGNFSWYVFNLADAAIVVGAVGLAIEALWRPKDAAKTGPTAGRE